jgi:iron complex outermembrane receptor protein
VADDYTTLFRDTGSATGGGINIKGDVLKYNALAFNFGVRYNKFKYFKPFVSFSQSFSVGELGRILRNATESDAINEKINTEAVIADNYEFGFKSNLTDKIRFQGVYFLSTSDLGTTYLENADTGFFELSRLPEQLFGIELQLDAKLSNTLDLGDSIATIEGKTDDNANGSFNDDQDNYINGTRVNPTIFRTFVSYTFSSKWNARLSSIFSCTRDKFDSNDDGTYGYGTGPVSSFTTTNLFSSYQLTSNTKLSLGIEKRLDKLPLVYTYFTPIVAFRKTRSISMV